MPVVSPWALKREKGADYAAAIASAPGLEQPLLGHAPDANRKPFSSPRCLIDPNRARNSEPYATLSITLDRAAGLAAGDVTGFSDPYCRLLLDGQDLGVKTKTQTQTLAPHWGETFEIEIHHPMSILTLEVWDEDFGTTSAGIDLLGTDDDRIAWLDMRLGSLPENDSICGWWPLHHADCYRDTLKAREEHMSQLDEASWGGRAFMTLKLTVKGHGRDLFAACLPAPSKGHGLPPLELGELFENGILLQKVSDNWYASYEKGVEQLLRYPSVVLIIAGIIAYWPRCLLPSVLISIPLVLYKIPRLYEARSKNEEAQEEKEKEEAQALAATLKSMQNFLPAENQLDLRLTQSNLKYTKENVEGLDASLEYRGLVAIACCVSAGLLMYFWMLQAIIMQVTFFVGVAASVAPYTMPFRVSRAAMWHHFRDRVQSRDMFEGTSDLAKDKKPASKVPRSQNVETVAAMPESDDTTHALRLTPRGHGLLSVHHFKHIVSKSEEHAGHDFKTKSFSQPTWCKSCGGFLWGASDQGFKCTHCRKVVCPTCVEDAKEEECDALP